MLLLLDLDNTLIDRDGAFRQWAERVVSDHGGGAPELEAIVQADAGGYSPRLDVAELAKASLRMPEPLDAIVEHMKAGVVELIRCYDGVLRELALAKSDGARLVIVTNGSSSQQRGKIARSGLESAVDAVVVSEEVRSKKPNAAIFERALEDRVGAEAVWMVGDNPAVDIAGARAVGIATGWVSHTKKWAEPWVPDIVGETTVDVLREVRRWRG
ncbi:MAG: HAD family hydrolase [Rhodoglobus sp.]